MDFGANNLAEIILKYGDKIKLGPGGTKRKREADDDNEGEDNNNLPPSNEYEEDPPPPVSEEMESLTTAGTPNRDTSESPQREPAKSKNPVSWHALVQVN